MERNLVYRDEGTEDLQEGSIFLITGKLAERFVLKFCLDNASKDIALRLIARATRNQFALNSCINGIWALDETKRATPFIFARNSNVEIQVFFNEAAILVALDGMHAATYPHRLPFTSIKTFEVTGDIKDLRVERRFTIDYPIRRKSTPHITYFLLKDLLPTPSTAVSRRVETQRLVLPYYFTFRRGLFKLGYRIIAVGHIKRDANMFKVALQVNQNVWPQPPIAVQLEFRFPKTPEGECEDGVLALNSYAGGKWMHEINSTTDIRPGSNFGIVIKRLPNSFEIYLDQTLVDCCPYFVNADDVNTLYIEGDIDLFDVAIERD